MIAAARNSRAVRGSPRISHPSVTATTGLTYAYVETNDVRTFRRSHRYALNPTKDPARINQASPIHDWVEMAETCNRWSSPVVIATKKMTPPPTICCMPLPSSGAFGSGARRA